MPTAYGTAGCGATAVGSKCTAKIQRQKSRGRNHAAEIARRKLQRQRLVVESPRIGDGLVDHLALHDV